MAYSNGSLKLGSELVLISARVPEKRRRCLSPDQRRGRRSVRHGVSGIGAPGALLRQERGAVEEDLVAEGEAILDQDSAHSVTLGQSAASNIFRIWPPLGASSANVNVPLSRISCTAVISGRIVGIAVLKIGIDRDAHGRCDFRDIAQRFIERHLAQCVRPSKAEGEAATGRSQRLEAMGCKNFRGTGIPSVGYGERPGLMQGEECPRLFSARHLRSSLLGYFSGAPRVDDADTCSDHGESFRGRIQHIDSPHL